MWCDAETKRNRFFRFPFFSQMGKILNAPAIIHYVLSRPGVYVLAMIIPPSAQKPYNILFAQALLGLVVWLLAKTNFTLRVHSAEKGKRGLLTRLTRQNSKFLAFMWEKLYFFWCVIMLMPLPQIFSSSLGKSAEHAHVPQKY